MIYIILLLILTIMAFTLTRILYHLESLKELQSDVEQNKRITAELYLEVRRQGRKSA